MSQDHLNNSNLSITPTQIIQKKRDGIKLSKEEIQFFINGFTHGSIADYQMSAFLMTVYFKGLDKQETADLTDAMLYSGKVLEFEQEHVSDKHSTGGIGDKASFILGPIAAAAGVLVPMIAGRSLGHTGGTIDKIECIPGFKTDIPLEKFKKLVIENGMSLIGQTPEIAPADKGVYALRDVTSTIDEVSLITASIMSKKLAEGAKSIVMDIKVGSGAFMKTKSQAKKLAQSIINTGTRFDKNMMTLITNMNQPLGQNVGHSLELIESIDTLQGNGPKDLTDISLELAAGMIYLSGKAKSMTAAMKIAKQTIKDGSALKKLELLISSQGGDVSFITKPEKLVVASTITEVKAKKSGYIHSFINNEIGHELIRLGGGRTNKEDKIDLEVGFKFLKKVGNRVKKNDTLLKIYHHPHQQDLVNDMSDVFLQKIIRIKESKPTKITALILDRVIKKVR